MRIRPSRANASLDGSLWLWGTKDSNRKIAAKKRGFIVIRVKSPNDPKLNDCGERRSLCGKAAGAGLRAGAQAVTPGAVRCSAWFGVAVISDGTFITVASVMVLVWLSLCPLRQAKTLEAELARSRRLSWFALVASLLALVAGLGLVRPMTEAEREKATHERMEDQARQPKYQWQSMLEGWRATLGCVHAPQSVPAPPHAHETSRGMTEPGLSGVRASGATSPSCRHPRD